MPKKSVLCFCRHLPFYWNINKNKTINDKTSSLYNHLHRNLYISYHVPKYLHDCFTAQRVAALQYKQEEKILNVLTIADGGMTQQPMKISNDPNSIASIV